VLFNSLTFIVFFVLVLALHNAPLGWKTKKTNLLIASYLFYAAWNPPFVILLWISTVIDWNVAKKLFTEQDQSRRKMWLAISVIVNLGLLGYFKYGEFLMENFVSLAAMAGIDYQAPEWHIILPVGISFYTFQTMAYSLDVYLKRAEPSKSFLDFALFVTFFPQLVAGPIVRPTHLLPQFATPRVATPKQLYWGLGLMTIGLFQKIVVADGLLAPVADAAFGAKEMLHPLDAWLGTLAFSGQIFSDFAGYSTTAIGVALTLGFGLPDNFRFPYAAIGFSDFWRRWHISLSSWLRDYLYGASWTFVVWGGLHGLYLAAERWLRARFGNNPVWGKLPAQIILAFVTYFLVNITWVFFRAADFPTAWRMIVTMLTFVTDGEKVLPTVHVVETIITIGIMLVIHWRMRERKLDEVVSRMPMWLTGAIWGVMLMLIVITQGGSDAFIYFQF
jgi:alginate O-acetyltransferase complex protein AlgI